MFGSFGGIPLDFKSLSLRVVRALRGYPIDFVAGGLRAFPGNSGEFRGRGGGVAGCSRM